MVFFPHSTFHPAFIIYSFLYKRKWFTFSLTAIGCTFPWKCTLHSVMRALVSAITVSSLRYMIGYTIRLGERKAIIITITTDRRISRELSASYYYFSYIHFFKIVYLFLLSYANQTQNYFTKNTFFLAQRISEQIFPANNKIIKITC